MSVVLDESAVPVRRAVRGACELLGLDPLYVANEGKLLAVVSADAVDEALADAPASRGRHSCCIGAVRRRETCGARARPAGRAASAGRAVGAPLPRIC